MIRHAVAAVIFCIGLCPAICLAGLAPVTPTAPETKTCEPIGNCRPQPERIELRTNANANYDFVVDPSPYVLTGTAVIVPGETLIFRFNNMSDEGPGDPTFVRTAASNPVPSVLPSGAVVQSTPDTNTTLDPKTGETYTSMSKGSALLPKETAKEQLKSEPPETMIVSFYQVDGKTEMVLQIAHNLPKPIKFDARMRRVAPTGPDMEVTSTCPVRPLLIGIEQWPFPIGIMTLSNFRYADTTEGLTCN